MQQAVLKPKEERRLLRGHRWAYRNEFQSLPRLDDGELVEVLSDKGRVVGRGFYQETGGIAVRIVSADSDDIDAAFFMARVDAAKALRDRIGPGETVYRWVYGESDGLPGLIADRYGPLVAVQAASPFYLQRAEDIAHAFRAREGVEGVLFIAKDEPLRFGNVETPVECNINGLTFSVDPTSGQKTGLFLDQRENWTLIERFATGATVLDGHCYTGAWGLHAAMYGASRVLGVDTSQRAIDTARANAARNDLEGTSAFECADIRNVITRGDKWDVIVLDPPALAKSRGGLKKALGLYQALNRDAMKALKPGGTLITSSCSQLVDNATFIETLKRAATSAQRSAQLLDLRRAAPDHPALLAMPETSYLTCAVVRVQ